MTHRILNTLVVAVLLLTAIPVSAQLPSTQRGVGLTQGDKIDISDMYFGAAGTYPVGAELTPSILNSYAGCKVVGIRFAVSQNISNSRIFLYVVENNTIGEPVISQKVRNAAAGWNEIYFNNNNSYDIRGDETLLLGYDYVETDAMVAAGTGAMCTAGTDAGAGFLAYGNFGSGEAWYSLGDYGNLCVQLIVDITSLPSQDIDFTYLFFGNKYKKHGEIIDFFSMYSSVGREKVGTYSLAYQIDQRPATIVQFADTLSGSESWEVEFPVPDDLSIGEHTFRVFVNSIDNQTPQAVANDTLESKFYVYANPLQRQQHYFEQYVHYQSPYVPYVSAEIDALAKTTTDVAFVNVSAAGTPLAVPEAAAYESLYAYTYPSFTIDRYYYPGEAHIAFDINDYVLIFPGLAAEAVRELVYEANLNPAFATVNIEPHYDSDTRQLTLHCTGTTSPDALPIFGDLAITLMLTEDNVQGMQAVYNEATQRTTWDNTYKHNHVLRQILTASAGDRLILNGNTFAVDYTVMLPTAWKPEDMHAVAFLTRYATDIALDEDDALEMDITNCNSIALHDCVTSGIVDTTSASANAVPVAYYSIDGQRVTTPSRGIYIVRYSDGQTRKIAIP